MGVIRKGRVDYIFGENKQDALKQVVSTIRPEDYQGKTDSRWMVLGYDFTAKDFGGIVEKFTMDAFSRMSAYSRNIHEGIVIMFLDNIFLGKGSELTSSAMRSQLIAALNWCENFISDDSNFRVVVSIDTSAFKPTQEMLMLGTPPNIFAGLVEDENCDICKILLDANKLVSQLNEARVIRAQEEAKKRALEKLRR